MNDWLNGGSFAIYYIRTVTDLSSSRGNFDGLGIYINPKDSVKQGSSRAINVRGVMDGQDAVGSCYWPVINADGWSRLSLEYNDQTLKVAFLADGEFETCFVAQRPLDFEGYFVFVASSGDFMPHEVTLDSFMLFDLARRQENRHF